MGRYWSTRRAGTNGPAAAGGVVLLVISNVNIEEPSLGASLNVSWDANRDSTTGWQVRWYLEGEEQGSNIIGGAIRATGIDFSCPAPGLHVSASVEAVEGETGGEAVFSEPHECLGD